MINAQDYNDVLNVVHQDFHLCDSKDFSGERSLWADELTVDFGGVNPEAEGVVAADTLIDVWERQLRPLEVVVHMLSSQIVTVDGDEASVTYYLQALHYHSALGESEDVNTWTHYGRGTHGLRRIDGSWKVVSVNYTVLHNVGNAAMIPQVIELNASSGN
ncbi:MULTISPECIES: nuclear transport factor 2 family protein [unclassified Streptomyces]|uniref:nuclear transport factor 2 family protein n=1 Tax=unclassified Streptomyces TaxID=2593676 RepID=UPI0037FC3DA1